jgi:hypothetical protein
VDGLSLVPFAVFGAVAVAVTLLCLASARRNGRVRQRDDGGVREPGDDVSTDSQRAGGEGPVESARAGGGLSAGSSQAKAKPATEVPLANRIASMVTVVVTALFITTIAPRLYPGPGFSFERMMCSGVVGGMAGGLGWVIGKAVEALRR